MAECAKGVYRPRRPWETPFYRLVEEHYERFEQVYPECYEDKYGYLRPVIRETVYKYLDCGDLGQGFATVPAPESSFPSGLPPAGLTLPDLERRIALNQTVRHLDLPEMRV